MAVFKRNRATVVAEGQLEIAEFRGKDIRKVLHHDEWYFSVVDVVGAVAEAPNPRGYWSDLKRKLVKEGMGTELYEDIVQLKMPGEDGKERSTDAADVEALFRIIQSIPSKKAERFKRWLAKVGYERLLETDNPDIAIKRAIAEYRAKGRDDEWIEARVRSRLAREELTSEWGRRGVLGEAYGILTNVIQKGTFGVEVQPHTALKGLKKHHNLRDHMTSLELLFTTLGERSTKDIAIAGNAHGFVPNKQAAERGGRWPVTPEKPWKSKQATRWFQMTTSCPPKVIRSNCRHPRMSKPPTLANSYGAVVNRLSQEFTAKFCTEDGLQ